MTHKQRNNHNTSLQASRTWSKQQLKECSYRISSPITSSPLCCDRLSLSVVCVCALHLLRKPEASPARAQWREALHLHALQAGLRRPRSTTTARTNTHRWVAHTLSTSPPHDITALCPTIPHHNHHQMSKQQGTFPHQTTINVVWEGIWRWGSLVGELGLPL